jgi:hypothetical protein
LAQHDRYRSRLALGSALFSYHGGLFWGLSADWDPLPDPHVLVENGDDTLARFRRKPRVSAGLLGPARIRVERPAAGG